MSADMSPVQSVQNVPAAISSLIDGAVAAFDTDRMTLRWYLYALRPSFELARRPHVMRLKPLEMNLREAGWQLGR